MSGGHFDYNQYRIDQIAEDTTNHSYNKNTMLHSFTINLLM